LDELERDRKKIKKKLFKKLYCQTLWHQISLLGYYSIPRLFCLEKSILDLFYACLIKKQEKKITFVVLKNCAKVLRCDEILNKVNAILIEQKKNLCVRNKK